MQQFRRHYHNGSSALQLLRKKYAEQKALTTQSQGKGGLGSTSSTEV
jgi:uncharacterized membrane protein